MILSCGESLIDFVPRDGENLLYAPCPGGSPYNFAIAAARLGIPAGFLGKISRDLFGDILFNRLVNEGVDTSFIQRSSHPSSLAFVSTESGKEPRYAFYTENSADRNLSLPDIPRFLADNVHCLEFGSISLLLEPQASTIKSLVHRERGKRALSYDPNIRPAMVGRRETFIAEVEKLARISTIVKVSSADLEWLYPNRRPLDSALAWLSRTSGIVVMTRGKDGAILLSPNFRVETPEYRVIVKDSIGAGDTFHAALLSRLHQLHFLSAQTASILTKEIAQEVLNFAVKASSISCTRQGADPPFSAEMTKTR